MKLFLSFLVVLSIFSTYTSIAQNPQYLQRRANYIADAINYPGGGKMILQAAEGLPVDSANLSNVLNNISTNVTADFDIIQLIRILYLAPGQYDSLILPVLNQIPFWVNNGDTIRNYWSENHMIMWMSSDWLLHERYNKPIDASLYARLQHYLELKNQYGYYEFFSSVYGPYCLSGILNLADFSQDTLIKNLAVAAAQRLLSDFMIFTNNKGTYFPVAGRNYPSKYEIPYGQNHNHLIYLLTGFGQVPNGTSAGGQFLATSAIPVDGIINSYTSHLDTSFYIGHPLSESAAINATMTEADKTIFQWSFGGYFHPAVVSETVQLLVDSNLWHQVDFALLLPLQPLITPSSAPALANTLQVISKSSVICGEQISVFKNKSITLGSVHDFWKGKVGFQQHPCVANIGTTAVYLGSGEVFQNWDDRSENNANVHLPYVTQSKNISLLMYRPEPTPTAIGPSFEYKDVALHFVDTAFDEIINQGNWILGRQEESYVAVRKHCIGEINSVRACPTDSGQSWVIMVGDSEMYGSFTNFSSIVNQSHFSSSWYQDSTTSDWVYYSKIEIDSQVLEYAWSDSLPPYGTNINPINSNNLARIFPNPSTESVNIDLTSLNSKLFNLRIINGLGQEVYRNSEQDIAEILNVQTDFWNDGIYMVLIETSSQAFQQKLIVRKQQ